MKRHGLLHSLWISIDITSLIPLSIPYSFGLMCAFTVLIFGRLIIIILLLFRFLDTERKVLAKLLHRDTNGHVPISTACCCAINNTTKVQCSSDDLVSVRPNSQESISKGWHWYILDSG